METLQTNDAPLLRHVPAYQEHLENSGIRPADAKSGARQCRLIIEAVGAKSIADLTPAKVEAYLAGRRRGTGAISAATSNRYLARIKAFINWRLRATNSQQVHPLRHLRKLTEGRETRRELTPDEQETLLAETADGPVRYGLTGPERVEVYRFGLETGLRANEIRRLTWRDFDLDSSSVTLRPRPGGRRPKVGNLVRQPLPAGLAVQLATRSPKDQSTRIFRLPAKAAEMIEADLIAARITTDGVVFHSLRHTYGANLLRTGCDLPTLQTLMRHKSIKMTIDQYGHVPTGAAQAALERAYGVQTLRLTSDTPESASGEKNG
jgi:integrase